MSDGFTGTGLVFHDSGQPFDALDDTTQSERDLQFGLASFLQSYYGWSVDLEVHLPCGRADLVVLDHERELIVVETKNRLARPREWARAAGQVNMYRARLEADRAAVAVRGEQSPEVLDQREALLAARNLDVEIWECFELFGTVDDVYFHDPGADLEELAEIESEAA